MSALPRPEWLFTDAAAVLIQATPLQQARAYIEHLEARCKALAEELESTFGYDTERFLDELADRAELEREARD